MKNDKSCDVIGLAYYILFYLRKQHQEVNVQVLQVILQTLQEYQVQTHHRALFESTVKTDLFFTLIQEVENEFQHYGTYPIQSRKTLERRHMAHEAKKYLKSYRLQDFHHLIDHTCNSTEFAGHQKMLM